MGFVFRIFKISEAVEVFDLKMTYSVWYDLIVNGNCVLTSFFLLRPRSTRYSLHHVHSGLKSDLSL